MPFICVLCHLLGTIFLGVFWVILPVEAWDEGIASFYGDGERLNRYTASGEVFNPKRYTCASYAYPFNRRLRVTNVETGDSVVVRVNDVGPHRRFNRLLDLTPIAFSQIAPLDDGLVEVRVEEVR